jgi:hypothetical protein
MAEAQPSSAPPVLRKSTKFYDEEGDLKIVSSDGEVFRAHAYHFQASSLVHPGTILPSWGSRPVFRSMIGSGRQSELRTIELDVPEFDTGESLTSSSKSC